ncbi:hypothetical protein L484_006783 [Morus notabilis]|uniref:Uncharacterized protein n=1 Tax=Morus notabilis TaxID=981085 RepID=W9RP51_9ROSA|nr:hypothetical protein L484_006783 [Morus notabilis]
MVTGTGLGWLWDIGEGLGWPFDVGDGRRQGGTVAVKMGVVGRGPVSFQPTVGQPARKQIKLVPLPFLFFSLSVSSIAASSSSQFLRSAVPLLLLHLTSSTVA